MYAPGLSMFILLPALAAGVLGLLARGHRRVVLILAIAAPVLSMVAFAAQLLPGGVQSCTSSTSGPDVCQSLPAVSAWGGPLPFLIAGALFFLSLAPLASVRAKSWWPAAISALLQAIPQVISFGFLAWAPALALTIAVAFALSRVRSVPASVASPPGGR
jgi:hypothetical protein